MPYEHPTRLDHLMHAIAEHHPMRGDIHLQLGLLAVRVESNSTRLLTDLTEYFRSYVAAPQIKSNIRIVAIEASEPDLGLPFQDWPRDPGKSGRKEEYADVLGGRVVRKVRTGMQFLLGPDMTMAVGACEQNKNQIINLIGARYTEALIDAGFVLCHAAGVAWDGVGVGMAGVSGAGKSTLALRLMSRGATFVSNDRLLVKPESPESGAMRMCGIPKLPRVNPGTLLSSSDLQDMVSPERAAQLLAMPEAALWELEEKSDVDIEHVYGRGRIALGAAMRAFVILTWKRGVTTPTKIERCSFAERADLVPLLAKHPGPFYRGEQQLAATSDVNALDSAPYLEALRALPVFEISGRVDFEQAEALCIELANDTRS